MGKLVEIINLNYKDLFNNLYLDIMGYDLLMIIGKNSCGKTTLANIIAGIIPTRDNILIDSELINYYNKDNISLIDGNEHNNEHIIVSELTSNFDKKEVLNLFKHYKKQSMLNRYCDTLSNGELQLLNILLAILKQPKIIIIDDSLFMIDKINKTKIFKHLKQLCDNKMSTVIYFTSEKEDLIYANDIAIINDKKIDIIDSKHNILSSENYLIKIDYNLPFIADLCLKLKYYDLIDKLILDEVKLVNKLWK